MAGKHKSSVIAFGEYISARNVSLVLSTKKNAVVRCVARWIKTGELPHIKTGPKSYVLRKGLAKLAMEKPGFFCHLERMDLVMLLDSEKAADAVLNSGAIPQLPYRREHRVKCVETGVVYPSIKEAAKAIYVYPNSIWAALKRSEKGKEGTAAGYHWVRV
mgnify:CR=1 FL=1